MKLFLDEMFTGSKEYYEALGWEVTTVQDEATQRKEGSGNHRARQGS